MPRSATKFNSSKASNPYRLTHPHPYKYFGIAAPSGNQRRQHSNHTHSQIHDIDRSPPTSQVPVEHFTSTITQAICDQDGVRYLSASGELVKRTLAIPSSDLFRSFTSISSVLVINRHLSKAYGMYLHSGDRPFPTHGYDLDLDQDVEGVFREPDIIPFPPDIFEAHWGGKSIALSGDFGNSVIIHPEHEFRGAKWRLYPLTNQITSPITMGTVFYIGNPTVTILPEIRYMASLCRAFTPENALIQLNAYKKSGERLQPFHSTWPTLTLLIPYNLCALKLPL